MTSLRPSAPRFKLSFLPFAILSLFLAANVQLMRGAAQEPDASPVPPPPPAVFQKTFASGQLSFLSDYAGHPAKEALKDKRLHAILKQMIPRTEYHYGRDMPLSDASEIVLDGNSLPVEIRDGRYVTIATSGGEYLSGKGFLWFDLQQGIALGGVFFHPTNGEPTPTLAIFSRQLKETTLSMSQLPVAFAQDLGAWLAEARVRPISPRYFIPDNGKKYVLVHDEDYCDSPPGAPAPPQDECQQLNADAADADLKAAYFMKETGNAANATAWMLNPELVTWFGVRDQTCGLGPGAIGCRIRITRQRTRVVIRQHS